MYTPLEKLGLFCLTVIAVRVAAALIAALYHWLAPAFSLCADLKNAGKWAVITGGTDGLGKSFAHQLGKMGMDIVLISRNKEKLDTVAAEIATTYNVNTKVLEADFTEGIKAFSQIEKELFGMDIGVLVNNVGVSYPHPDFFLNLANKEKIYSDIIQCNIVTMLAMCQIVMPGMVEQKKGVVINISSIAADIPSPLLSVYGASKVFVSKFTKDLATEYRRHGLIIQCLEPGFVATKMSKIRNPTWMAPSPNTYTSQALKTVGIRQKTTGYYPHTLLLNCIRFMESISSSIVEWIVMRTMENIRGRSIRKMTQTRG